MSHKICSACKVSKPLAEFYRDRSKKLGVTPACKPCSDERHNKWRIANPKKAAYQSRVRWEKYLSLVREKHHLEFQRSNRFAAIVLKIGLIFVRAYFAMKEASK